MKRGPLRRWATHPSPNLKLRGQALAEAYALMREAMHEQADAVEVLRATARRTERDTADRLYGAEKYGRDVREPIYVPSVHELTTTPPHFEFAVDHASHRHVLWDGSGWVEINSTIMRRPESHHLRTMWAAACARQAMVESLGPNLWRLRNGDRVRVEGVDAG